MLHPFYTYALGLLLTGTLIQSCKDSDLNEASETQGTEAIAFGTQLDEGAELKSDSGWSVSETSGTKSKAIVTDVGSMADFKVWGWAHKGQSYTNLFNETKVFVASGMYEGDLQYWSDGYTYDFFAVHPFSLADVSVSQQGALRLDFDASAMGSEVVDVMTADRRYLLYDKGLNAHPGPVQLSFSHELAKVEFVVKAEQKASVTAKLFGIGHEGVLTKKYSAAASPWSSNWVLAAMNTEGNTPFTMSPIQLAEALATTAGTSLFSGALLLPPQVLRGASGTESGAVLQLTYTYENQETVTSNVMLNDVKSIGSWEAGKSYRYEITIPKLNHEMNITVMVADWNNKDISTIL